MISPAKVKDSLSTLTIHHSPFIIHHSSSTIHHSPFTVHHSPSPFTTHHSPLIHIRPWDGAVSGCSKLENLHTGR